MSTGLSDYAERMPARGASVSPAEEFEAPEAVSDQPSADEAALMNILRLLNRVRPAPALTPVERAFVLGAKAMFTELTGICDALLTLPTPTPSAAAAAAPTPPVPAQTPSPAPAPTGRARARQRPTPGGGALQ
jgi:hypothetical protein